eukprot:CAMPEP_0183489856 /NCGR_PEP_ID=MMETSP0370-20130417/181649_1 /TAXON_ID=268820 /ORGANISM="Peridinium aciculiferum, Strain PAER-2" /LENGTH=664 /DNA_ID=CAMNT_0025683191 /DNA_START=1 /DNA_END=1996 /DNA_ORIENTATION=+
MATMLWCIVIAAADVRGVEMPTWLEEAGCTDGRCGPMAMSLMQKHSRLAFEEDTAALQSRKKRAEAVVRHLKGVFTTFADVEVHVSAVAQQACSLCLLAGRNFDEYMAAVTGARELGILFLSVAELSVDKTIGVTAGDAHGKNVTYAFLGEHLGCVRVEGASGPSPQLGLLSQASVAIDGLVDESQRQLSVDKTVGVTVGDVHGTNVTYAFLGNHLGCVRMEGPSGPSPQLGLLSQASVAIDGLVDESQRRLANTWPAGLWPSAAVPQPVLDFADTAIEDPDAYAILVSYKGTLVERYSSQLSITAESKLHGWSMAKSVLSLLIGARQGEGKLDPGSYIRAPEIGDDESKLHGWSMAKSILSLLIGARQGEGKLDPVSHIRASEIGDDEKMRRNLTIENVLSMRVGQPLDETFGSSYDLWAAHSSAAYALEGFPRHSSQDGEFYYSSANSNLNSRELRYTFADDAQGLAEYLEYPWQALFAPIGATSFACEVDPASTFVFSSFCYAPARDYMKIGQLILQKGSWEGEQIIPAEWIESTTRVVSESDPEYAMGWWRQERMYPQAELDTPVISAAGVQGQYTLVIPEHDLVIVRLGLAEGRSTAWWKRSGSPLKVLLDFCQVPLVDRVVRTELRVVETTRSSAVYHFCIDEPSRNFTENQGDVRQQ